MKRFMTMLVIAGLILVLVALPFMTACAKPAPAPKLEPIVLKAVQADPLGHPLFVGWEWYVKTVNTRAEGELIIDVLGGTEIIPLADQADAVKDGIIDINCNYGSWVEKVVPAMGMWHLRRIPPDEMRKRGAYDLIQEEMNKVGIYWLGPTREMLDCAHWITVNKWVESPKDLAGLRIATFAGLAEWLEALGMIPLVMPPGERYSAIERGIADGGAHSLEGQFNFAYYELIDYWIDYGVFSSGEMMLVNLNRWNNLPEHLQKLLIDIQLELEGISGALALKSQDATKRGLRDGGMKPITFSSEDAEWYVSIGYEVKWQELFKKYPEWGPKVYELWALP